ncbi:lysylphosphatidylglycerol synthase domain-containing protein [Nakamurella lactea]|uniref:lysylphosphatidylglycerol synthase domain-containing protein n=1 Tax=Nakamurella lactea TaxID=459515 RepID=UPI000491408C|nr:lysylphosphatidylglycerol synthase domain-containing protein [Nakamurella lactea]
MTSSSDAPGAQHPTASAEGAAPPVGGSRRRLLTQLVKIVGFVIAIVAVGLCVRILVREWPTVSAALRHANLWLLLLALLLGGIGMWLLAVLWWRCLAVFGVRRGVAEVSSWYFAGELGKYLPGGIWTVVGRGELARRAGVSRSTAYATTLFSLALMCVGGGVACGLLVPFFALDGGRFGPELMLIALVPIGIVVVHPAVFGRLLALAKRVTKGRLDLTAPRWSAMLGLIALATPTWLAVGAASSVITAALGFEQQPARVAFAAVVAWIVGFLAVPVPAGAGIRELLFIVACGMAIGPATAVAGVARVFLIVVDAVGGIAGLLTVRWAGRRRPAEIGQLET